MPLGRIVFMMNARWHRYLLYPVLAACPGTIMQSRSAHDEMRRNPPSFGFRVPSFVFRMAGFIIRVPGFGYRFAVFEFHVSDFVFQILDFWEV